MPPTATAPAVDTDCALFDGITPGEQARILADATLRSYAPQQIVMHQGARAERFFLLASGCARFFVVTEDGKKLPLLWTKPGDIIGGMGVLLHQRSYLLNCETIRPCEIYVWPRETMRKHLSRVPRLLDNGMQIASRYLERLLSAYVSLTCDSAKKRLADVLIGYAQAIGEHGPEGILIDATNEEFAHAAHITKYTTCRLLAEWQKNGAIAKRRGKILLCDLDHFRQPTGKSSR